MLTQQIGANIATEPLFVYRIANLYYRDISCIAIIVATLHSIQVGGKVSISFTHSIQVGGKVSISFTHSIQVGGKVSILFTHSIQVGGKVSTGISFTHSTQLSLETVT